MYKMKDFDRQKGERTRKLYQAKKQFGYCKVTYPIGTVRQII